MKTKFVGLLLFSFFIYQNTFSQKDKEKKSSSTENFEAEDSYLKKRFDDFNGSRILEKENYTSALQSMIEANRNKSFKNKKQAVSGWIPLGPNVISNVPSGQEKSVGIGRMSAVRFHPTDSNILYTVVGMGGLWKSTNHGKSWIPLTDQFPNLRVADLAIDPKYPDTMYLCTGDYNVVNLGDVDRLYGFNGTGVYKTIDGGITWSPTGLSFEVNGADSNLVKKIIISSKNSNHLIAIAYTGIYKSQDGGVSWTKKASNFMYDIDASKMNDSIVFASTGNKNSIAYGIPGIYKSADFGDTWTFNNLGITTPTSVIRIEMDFSDQNDSIGFAVLVNSFASLKSILKTNTRGDSWSEIYTSDNNYNLLSFGNFKGSVQQGQAYYDIFVKIHPTDSNNVFVGGINVWSTVDGGKNWLVVSGGQTLHSDQHGLEYNPLDNYFYCVNDGGIYRTKKIIGTDPNLGLYITKWENLNDGIQVTSFYRLGINPNSENLFGGGSQDNSTYYFDGTNWNLLFGGDGMEFNLDPNNENIIWGSSQSGIIYYSTDYGKTSTFKTGAGSGAWTTPMKLNPQNPKSFYAGYFNMAKLDHIEGDWIDLGKFTGTSAAPTITDFDIQQLDSNTIYAFRGLQNNPKSKNKILVNKTINGGITWTNITSNLPKFVFAKSISVDPLNKDKAWITFGDYIDTIKVYKTINGGLSWINIRKNLPNTPINEIAVHHFSKFNMLYVATDLGVYYTNDTMNTWEPYNENLPSVVVSELEINYKSNKLFAATFGRGMWKSDLIETLVDSSKIGVSSPHMYASEISVYPNPNKGNFLLTISSELNNFDFEIIDIMGRVVYNEKIIKSEKLFSKKLNLQLSSGMYFSKIENGNKSKVTKFIIE